MRLPNTYLLLISYRSTDPRLAAEVANAIARSYIRTTYEMKIRASTDMSTYMADQLFQLRAKMEKSSAALAAFERDLNVINPEQRTGILSARLLQLNTEYTTAQADRVRKEAAYESVKSGSLEAAQVSTQGEALKTISGRLNEAEEKFADTKTRYGTNHPEYKKAAAVVAELRQQLDAARQSAGRRVEVEYREAVERERMLQKSVTEAKTEFDRMNARSIEYQSVKNEADADRRFYNDLIRKVEEARINSTFQNNAIRLADMARPGRAPVSPNMILNVFVVLMFSTILAIGAVILSDMLDNRVHDPDSIQRAVNIRVLGMLPEVKAKHAPALVAPGNGTANGHLALMRLNDATDRRATGYVEAIRMLLNSILLGNLESPLRSLLVTSASTLEGKTTVAVHLALAYAEQRHRTLLIDCDLRRPSLHEYFDIPNDKGLTSVTENERWQNLVVTVPGVPELDFLPSGPTSRRAPDLIGRAVRQILDESEKFYDLVVIDAPPMLGCAESLYLSTLADSVVVVALAGGTTRTAVSEAVNTLKRVNANVIGVVINKVSARAA